MKKVRVVSVEEKGKKFTLKTCATRKVEKHKIDGELIDDNNVKRCDWAITVDSDERLAIYFIELKGTDLKQAIYQLQSTVEHMKDFYMGYREKQAHVVCKEIRPIFNSTAQNLAVIFAKKYRFILKWHSQCAVVSHK